MGRKKKAIHTTEQLADIHRKFHPREDNPGVIEIIPALSPIGPKEPSAELKAYLESMVRQRVDEILTASGIEMESDFRPREIAKVSRQSQNVFERQKWALYFEKWGCRMCGKKAAAHGSTGHCGTCVMRVQNRLKQLKLEYERTHPESEIERNIERLTLRARSAEELLRGEREE